MGKPLRVVPVILLALVVAACTPAPLVPVDVSVTVGPAEIGRTECPRDGAGVLDLYGRGRPRGRPPGVVPTGFVGVVVLSCDIDWDGRTPLSGDQARVRLDQLEAAATGDFLAALSLPDRDLSSLGACGGAAGQPPYLLLADERGRTIRPYLPRTSCGDLRPEVWRAIDDLTFRRMTSFTFVMADR